MIAGWAPGAITADACCVSGAVGDWRLQPETRTSAAMAAARTGICVRPRVITRRPRSSANMTCLPTERPGPPHPVGLAVPWRHGGRYRGERAPSESTVVADGKE